MTRTILLLLLGCFLVVGAAAASILSRSSVPAAQYTDTTASISPEQVPTSNKEGKRDRLAVAAPAPVDPQQVFPPVGEPLRQAFASESTVDLNAANVAAAAVIPSQRPKQAAKPAPPPVQKNYTLLSDAQIASIKGRLNLTSSQESYWPAIEDALRRIAKKMHEQRQAKSNAGGPPIDPDSAEVQQLKSAAMPLLFQLREDQKREVRALARIIGLEAVASAI